jgi:FAD/FMN-containing dehydrogenase/Fe-S oxidoreductase
MRRSARPDFRARLVSAVRGTVESGSLAKAQYAMDASNYRHPPLAVVCPADGDDVAAAVRVAREFGVPVTARGGGTSVAGNAIGRGLVLDLSRHLNRIPHIDPERRLATVEPGVVLDDLRAAAAPHGLTFGPDPSTHSRCTIGGMIGNDACGSHSVRWGRTADNVDSLDLLLYDGTRMRVGPGVVADAPRERQILRDLNRLAQSDLAELRTGFPQVTRRVSGYALDALLPERGFDVARSLVGSEGTCATVLAATLRLVPTPPATVLLVLGFRDEVAAAAAVPDILPFEPLTVEGMDARLLALATGAGARSVSLPQGEAWLFVEMEGSDVAEATDAARTVAAAVRTPSIVLADPAQQRVLWRAREEGAGLATRSADGAEAWPGWEDAAVPPERLASYLEGFRALLARHARRGIAFGHFGEGCIHVRVDADLVTRRGVAGFRSFIEDAAGLVLEHGGSFSGEHGDGQARSELLPLMYSPRMIGLFERFKAIWDPADGMNPGVIVRPRALDDDLRFRPPAVPLNTRYSYPDDAGDFAQAMRRCVGVGKCREPHPSSDVMCPSFRATRDEKDSTRGRARVLLEMVNGGVIGSGWRSPEVRSALDLCLSCKGCRSDCPVGVDMATYKSEFLYHHYRRRLRPAAHYSMGHLPTVARLASAAPRSVNAVTGSRSLGPLLRRLGGIARERSFPEFARPTFTSWSRTREPAAAGDGRPVVLLWPDTFTNYFAPHVGVAATEVLEAQGFEVRVPTGRVCCGLTWMSTGQLGTATRVVRRTQRILRPAVDGGVPIVVLEPSCAAALRVDLPELIGDDRTRRVAAQVSTFAEFLDARGAGVPTTMSARSIRQEHCHQHAVLGSEADERVLAGLGVQNTTLASGCCGLAGNFGFERGHYDVSQAIGEQVLLPAVRAARPDTMVLADGFSCRTQIEQATGRQALHLAEVVARAQQQKTK